jgi:hypothetical protein
MCLHLAPKEAKNPRSNERGCDANHEGNCSIEPPVRIAPSRLGVHHSIDRLLIGFNDWPKLIRAPLQIRYNLLLVPKLSLLRVDEREQIAQVCLGPTKGQHLLRVRS